MFLRAIVLRGFKSFADPTTLPFDAGITAIVGPNGSGKSNIVDALAWVLGTAAPSRLRSGSMADVIFAGSATRPPANRAVVDLILDNRDGVLGRGATGTVGSAQRYREVRITREVLPTGEGTYRINGEEVRALDVQELLAHARLGQRLHTVVGQGQLDALLDARPEDRRALIEEAAGVLAYRRRRERAVRKLEGVEAHVATIRALVRELRRQLKPLEQQAQHAARHDELLRELRAVRSRLLGHQYATLAAELAAVEASAAAVAARSEELAAARDAAVARREQVTEALRRAEQRLQELGRVEQQLATLRERLRGAVELIDSRRRHLIETVEPTLAGRPPAALRAAADRADTERAEVEAQLRRVRAALEAATERRRALEAQHAELDRRRREAEQLRATHRERTLRWEGEVQALRGAIAAAEAEAGRLAAQLDGLDVRLAEADAEAVKVRDEIARLEAEEATLVAAVDAAEAELARTTDALTAVHQQQRELERRRAALLARAEALRAATARVELLDHADVAGRLSDLLEVEDGWAAAVVAALGPLSDALVVTDHGRAVALLRQLRTQGGTRVVLLPSDATLPPPPPLPAPSLAQRVSVPADRGLEAAVRGILGGIAAVEDLTAAEALRAAHPHLTVVTRDGDLLGPAVVAGGAPPRVVTAADVRAAERQAAEVGEELEALAVRAARLERARERRAAALRAAGERLDAHDARIAAATDRLARIHEELVALRNQREVIATQAAELERSLAQDRQRLAALLEQGPGPAPEVEEVGSDPDLEAALAEVRSAEIEQRAVFERLSERVRHLEATAGELRREAADVERTLADAARRRARREQAIVRCRELGQLAAVLLGCAERWLAETTAARERAEGEVAERRAELRALEARLEELDTAAAAVREEQHAIDLRRSELLHRRERLAGRVRDQLGHSLEELAETAATVEDPAALEAREDELVRHLELLGRINPLALEEFRALEQRHAFLSGQLEDLRRSRRDLERVIAAVDERIREEFLAAFEDVARHFTEVFATLFPGGRGRLRLVGDDDPLHAGVEIDARPAGKRVERLSLLSGGERSLTVLAFVLAIFRARPSPFYVLDEVDAALDDSNIGRLLAVLEELRGRAQLLIVTHQRRTMEAADLLYGVTMGRDGVSRVVAQRVEELSA